MRSCEVEGTIDDHTFANDHMSTGSEVVKLLFPFNRFQKPFERDFLQGEPSTYSNKLADFPERIGQVF